MAEHLCPPWVAYLLLSPLRKLLENPVKMFGPFVREGMTVLEPGCAMGYFTLPLARMVGADGRVVVVELQAKMLTVLERRARKAGLLERIEMRQTASEGLGVEDLAGQVDFAAAIHLVHELPDQATFFENVFQALKPGGKMLMVEPSGHVSQADFDQSISRAKQAGFESEPVPVKMRGLNILLLKP